MSEFEKDAEHIGIWGRTKSGKSTRARELIKAKKRLLVFDGMDEYGALAPVRVESVAGLRKAIRAGWKRGFKIRYCFGDDADAVKELDGVARALKQVQQPYKTFKDNRKITFLVEEMAECFPNVRRPASDFGGLCHRGRHFGIELIGVSQRMADVSTVFRGCTSEDYFFPPRASVDIDAAVMLIGKDNRAGLQKLVNHQFYSFKGGELKTGKN